MSADIIIPWSGDCVYRASARSYIESRWRSLGFNVIIGEMEGPWSKALAVQDALKRSTSDVIVVTDGDVWTDAAPDAAGIVAEFDEIRWCCPFGVVKRLNQASTAEVLAGGELGGKLIKPPFKAVPGGGLVVIEREAYNEVPLDPRFVGWGHEDEAWGMALRWLLGRPTMAGDTLWHLWHPPQDKTRTVERRVNLGLRTRYSRCRRDLNLMRELVSEARDLLEW